MLAERLGVWFASFAPGWKEALWLGRLWVHRALSRANVLEELCRTRKERTSLVSLRTSLQDDVYPWTVYTSSMGTHTYPFSSHIHRRVLRLFMLYLTWSVLMNMTWPLHGRVNNVLISAGLTRTAREWLAGRYIEGRPEGFAKLGGGARAVWLHKPKNLSCVSPCFLPVHWVPMTRWLLWPRS